MQLGSAMVSRTNDTCSRVSCRRRNAEERDSVPSALVSVLFSVLLASRFLYSRWVESRSTNLRGQPD